MGGSKLPDYIRALLSPDVYDHPVDDVDLVQTHISYVFLAGQYVYKVKKPVDMGFLDYSTLEKRRLCCEEELRLNRRLCPDAYLEVVSIRLHDGQASLGGTEGDVVDYAVKMKRLPEDRMMERLLRENLVTSDMLQRLTEKLVTFHQNAATGGEIDSFGSIETIRDNWRENLEQTRPYIGRTISDPQWQKTSAYVARFLGENQWLFEQRIGEGRIRDCHGDLRTNAVCFENGICVFDCIEFNERFRYGDVASELAFLAMDVDFRGRRDLSDEMVGLYLTQSVDTTLPLLLHFYKCYRAFVRGKVDGFQIDQSEVPEKQRQEAAVVARAYFKLVEEYANDQLAPVLLIMIGVTGSGKSYLANALAGRLGAAVISSDVTRKRLAGIHPSKSQIEPIDAGIYSQEMTEQTYGEMLNQAELFLERRFPVILDASYLRREHRQAALSLTRRLGVQFLAIECHADESLVKERLRMRRSAVWNPSDGRLEVYRAQLERADPVTELRKGELLRIEGTLPLGEQLGRVKSFLRGQPASNDR
jgi:aminoglycoside phosphotransferase family enzyme/predicted kinase